MLHKRQTLNLVTQAAETAMASAAALLAAAPAAWILQKTVSHRPVIQTLFTKTPDAATAMANAALVPAVAPAA